MRRNFNGNLTTIEDFEICYLEWRINDHLEPNCQQASDFDFIGEEARTRQVKLLTVIQAPTVSFLY